jgi:hypothetical protein
MKHGGQAFLLSNRRGGRASDNLLEFNFECGMCRTPFPPTWREGPGLPAFGGDGWSKLRSKEIDDSNFITFLFASSVNPTDGASKIVECTTERQLG